MRQDLLILDLEGHPNPTIGLGENAGGSFRNYRICNLQIFEGVPLGKNSATKPVARVLCYDRDTVARHLLSVADTRLHR